MEFVIELLFELLLEGLFDATDSNAKVPKWVRILAWTVIGVIYVAFCGGLIYIGIVNGKPVVTGIAVFITVVVAAVFIKKCREYKKKRRNI